MVRPVVVLTNSPAPYREPLWREIARASEAPFEVWYASRKASGRQWQSSEQDASYCSRFFRFFHISRKSRGGGRRSFGIAPGVVFRLLFRPPAILVCGDAGWTSLLALAASLVRRGPLIIWSESISNTAGSGLRRSLARKLSRRARAYVVPGRRTSTVLRELGVSEEKILIAPQSTDSEFWSELANKMLSKRDELREKADISPDQQIVLYVGGLWRRKRVSDLCSAITSLRSKGLPVQLWIVGGQSDADEGLMKSVTELVDQDVVKLFDYTEPSKLAEFYAMADCLCLVSDYDPWGFVVNEAQYFGLPVVVSQDVGASDDLVTEQTGVVVSTGVVEEIAEGIPQVLKLGEDEPNRTAIKQHIEKFSPEAQAEGFLRAVEMATGKG